MDADLTEQMPFTIASAHEFEIACQVIARTGIALPISKKDAAESRSWSLLAFLSRHFPDEVQKVNWLLFEQDWESMTPVPPNANQSAL